MIKEVTYDEIPRTIYKRGFVLSWPPGRSEDIFFTVDEDISWILEKNDSVWDYIAKPRKLPTGINMVKALDEHGKYLLVAYDKKEINKDNVREFIGSLFNKDIDT